MVWTTDSFVAAVKRKAYAPAKNWPFTDAMVLDIAWEETMKRIVPEVRAVRENYWTTTLDIPLVALSTGAYPTYVRVPTRAAASSATSVWVVLTDGSLSRLTRVPAAERQLFATLTSNGNSGPSAYSLEGDKMYLYPPTSAPGLTVRVEYDRRPSRYVLTADCGVVSSVTDTTVTAPGGTFSASTTVDVVQANPPCDILIDSAAASYALNIFTFTSASTVGAGIALGDYVCPYGYTCVLPLPDVLHLALIDLTVAVIKSESKDYDRALSLREEVASYMPGLVQSLAVRVAADPLVAFNRQSPLRTGFYGPRWGRR